MLPLLTIIADFIGMCRRLYRRQPSCGLPAKLYWTTVWQILEWPTTSSQGLLKPLVFAVVISMVGCYFGLRTTGGTQGVGRSTTQAVVAATVRIFILD